MNLHDILHQEILPRVEKPSRYLGNELNSVHKNLDEVELRIVLLFPDLYDLGLGNLGILILYAILNDLPWCWCERAYAPAPDMETELRRRGLPLFCHESKDSLADTDLIGFTLQSELTYTNILTCIDLAGLPLRAKDRPSHAPLLFAGGPAAFNPEPLAPFIDFFVIGDGEDVIIEIADLMRGMKDKPRREKLEALAELEGIYVPELYPMDVMPDGQVLPKQDAPKIVKRVVRDFDSARFPTEYIVPFTQQVHDRLTLEVLRGCTQGCRFCQAGMVTRPVRERSLQTIDALMEESLANTGYEEVSLMSLSTCDFSRPRTLLEQSARRAAESRVSVSLPSLRLDSFSVEMADMVADVRRSGLTFAPEAATPRLRAVINKWIPDQDLLDMARQAFFRGWRHVKCYFMIGLPTERDEDVQAIASLCERTLEAGRHISSKARINLGVSTFVPKPFTPFQWASQIGLEEIERRQQILLEAFKRTGGIKFGRHSAKTTFIEGLISRADRRAADLIEAAWRNGARFESWDERCDLQAWRKAVEDTAYDVQAAFRERDPDERLPWDHIDVLIPKAWLQQEWERAAKLEHAQDCRAGKCHLCGVIDRERELCQTMLKNQRSGRDSEQNWTPDPMPEHVEPVPVQRLRFRIGRTGEARFLSHLESMNAWVRALRRARAPLAYSQGFHAHPKINFAAAAPLGEESTGDLMDIILNERVEAETLLKHLQALLPQGFHAFDAEEVPLKAPSLMSAVEGFSYTIHPHAADSKTLASNSKTLASNSATLASNSATLASNSATLAARIAQIVASEEVLVERKQKAKGKKKKRGQTQRLNTLNIRPMMAHLALRPSEDAQAVIDFTTSVHEGKMAKAKDIIALLGLDPHSTRVVKHDTHLTLEANQQEQPRTPA